MVGIVDLLGSEFAGAATVGAPGLGQLDPFALALFYDRAFELGDCTEQVQPKVANGSSASGAKFKRSAKNSTRTPRPVMSCTSWARSTVDRARRSIEETRTVSPRRTWRNISAKAGRSARLLPLT